MTNKIIIANWKMNHAFDEADIWLETFIAKSSENKDKMADCEAIICPQLFLLDYVDSELMDGGFKKLESILKEQHKDIGDFSEDELTKIILDERPIKLGAQDCHHEVSGSFTGDVSASSLKKIGCEYVIVGHSERRSAHHESDQLIAKKAKAARDQDITPIICIGESKETREQKAHLDFLSNQIDGSIPKDATFDKLIVAYEPIWSIGTGKIPTCDEIKEVARLVRKIFDDKYAGNAKELFVLYGGSVSTANAGDILSVDGINGLLVGKVSLDADKFFEICIS